MTTHTTVNVDLCIVKLQKEIEGSVVFATVKTALLEMAVRALEQQMRELAIFHEREANMQGAIVEALTEPLEVVK